MTRRILIVLALLVFSSPAGASDRVLHGELVVLKGSSSQFRIVGTDGTFTAPAGTPLTELDGKAVNVEVSNGRVTQITEQTVPITPVTSGFETIRGQLVLRDPSAQHVRRRRRHQHLFRAGRHRVAAVCREVGRSVDRRERPRRANHPARRQAAAGAGRGAADGQCGRGARWDVPGRRRDGRERVVGLPRRRHASLRQRRLDQSRHGLSVAPASRTGREALHKSLQPDRDRDRYRYRYRNCAAT